jgi:ribonuclease Z
MGPRRKGRKFSFVTDTTWVPRLPAFVAGSDLLICEGMFGEDLAEDAGEKKHLTSAQAAQIALEGGVGRLGLIHYSPRYTEWELKRLRNQARKIFPATFLTRDLQVVDLPYNE